MEINISLDLGSDTLKVAYAFTYLSKDYYGKITPESYDGFSANPFPAVAFYHEEENKWYFGDQVDSISSNSYFNTVKIKSLLSLLSDFGNVHINRENREFYKKTNHFPKFHFPLRRMVLQDYQQMIDLNLTFEAQSYTPKDVCSMYFDYVYDVVTRRIKLLLSECQIKDKVTFNLAIVYPTKSNIEYINELKRLIETSFKQKAKTVQSSNKCLCQFAKYLGMVMPGEKILLFDMGEEDISVAKAYLATTENNESAIAIDGQSGHSDPIEIGGNDIDEVIANKIEEKIRGREIPGTPSFGELGHIVEKGLNAKQYLFIKNIKMAKTYFSRMNDEPFLASAFDDGIPIDIHREVYIQTSISSDDVLDWIGIKKDVGIVRDVVQYIRNEVRLPVNHDVSKVLLCGGLAETIGLQDYISTHLPRKIKVLGFDYAGKNLSQFSIQKYEDSVYAAALGGAMIALKNYKILIALTLSYGTFLYSGNPRLRFLRVLVNKGTILPKEGAEFLTYCRIYGSKVEQELLSTHLTKSEISRSSLTLTYDRELVIFEPKSRERKQVEEKAGLKVISGSQTNNAMDICFYVKKRGEYKKVKILPDGINFIEGIKIDPEGRIKPFIRTITKGDYDALFNHFKNIEGYGATKADQEARQLIEFNNQMVKVTYLDYPGNTEYVCGFDIVIEYDNFQDNLAIDQDDRFGE